MKKETKTFSIRLDTEILDKIRNRAKEEKRSVNYVIIEILEESFSDNKNNVKINNSTLKEMKTYCKKSNMNVTSLIENIWLAFKKTYM